ncbi:MAG: hypothetical protein ACRD6W_01610, partial [Nitrososphaerales archaeon]
MPKQLNCEKGIPVRLPVNGVGEGYSVRRQLVAGCRFHQLYQFVIVQAFHRQTSHGRLPAKIGKEGSQRAASRHLGVPKCAHDENPRLRFGSHNMAQQ